MVRARCLVKILAVIELSLTSYDQIHSIWCVGPCLASVASVHDVLFRCSKILRVSFCSPCILEPLADRPWRLASLHHVSASPNRKHLSVWYVYPRPCDRQICATRMYRDLANYNMDVYVQPYFNRLRH